MNKTHQAKKPLWKRPLGITAIILGIIVILGITGVLDDEPTATETPTVAVKHTDPQDETQSVKKATGPHADKITNAYTYASLDNTRPLAIYTSLHIDWNNEGVRESEDFQALREICETVVDTYGDIKINIYDHNNKLQGGRDQGEDCQP